MESASLPRTLQRHQTTAWVTFVFVATMTLLGAFLPQQRYEATSVVSVQPATEQATTQLLDYLIPSLEARVSGSALAAAVDRGLPVALRDPERVVSTLVLGESGVLNITVSSENPQVPVAMANAYAEFLATQNLGTPAVRVLVIDSATKVKHTSSPTTLVLSGLALGVILAPLVTLVRGGWGLDEDDGEDDGDDGEYLSTGGRSRDVSGGTALAGLPVTAGLDPAPEPYQVR